MEEIFKEGRKSYKGRKLDSLIIIPCRAGSKRVANKNFRLLNNTPLVYYTINTALLLNTNIYISTNSLLYIDLINNIYKDCSYINCILRPLELAQDDSTDKQVIDHVVNQVNPRPGFVIYLRPTTPLRDLNIVKSALTRFISQDQFTALRSVEPLTESAYKSFIIENNQLYPAFRRDFDANMPNQMYPATYRNNGYIDIYRNEYNDLKVMAYVTPRTVEIDTEDDLEYAEWLISHRKA